MDIEKELENLFDIDDDLSELADSGSEYDPYEKSDLDSTPSKQEQGESIQVKPKGRKRVKNEKTWKRNIRKDKHLKGKQYVNSKGKVVHEKQPKIGPCHCSNECHMKITQERQIQIFNDFYNLESLNMQTSYLFTIIKVCDKQRSYTQNPCSRRQKSRVYVLLDSSGIEVKVCKNFFQNTLLVSAGRIDRVLKNKGQKSTPPSDRRGKGPSANKTSQEKIAEVKDFIEKFPAYESHYALHKSINRKYMSPDLNIIKLYSLYTEQATNPVSNFVFRKIFNEEFNLSFHPPVSDSCRKCDAYAIKIKAAESEAHTNNLKQELELHQRKAMSARTGLQNDTELAKNNPEDVTVITFDLMKTLPTPLLSTGICYYKRQLWTYCFGIHNMGNNDVYMFLWNESVASRGPQEIGSCILHFLKKIVTTQHLIMYSDQCGGQNRNIKLSLLCQYIVSSPEYTVKKIDHKFLVSGHSYLPCDQDFGLVEKQKKLFPNIFIPEHWNNVILTARKRNPFKIICMEKSDFFSTKKLECNITHRKVDVDKSKVEWLKIQWLKFSFKMPFKIFFKYSNNEITPFSELNLEKRNTTLIGNLDLLYPNGNCINPLKKKDLLCLLDFVPPIHHEFYNSLKTNIQSIDVNELPLVDNDFSDDE
ncbi:hypothetical protein QTP88_000922 [Uroleucon formosanum]